MVRTAQTKLAIGLFAIIVLLSVLYLTSNRTPTGAATGGGDTGGTLEDLLYAPAAQGPEPPEEYTAAASCSGTGYRWLTEYWTAGCVSYKAYGDTRCVLYSSHSSCVYADPTTSIKWTLQGSQNFNWNCNDPGYTSNYYCTGPAAYREYLSGVCGSLWSNNDECFTACSSPSSSYLRYPAWDTVYCNSPPTTPTTLTLTDPVYVGSTLTATGSGSTDSDAGDVVTYYYAFYNGATTLQAQSTDNTYVIQVSDAHDTITVRTWAHDGSVFSTTYLQGTRVVSNTAPTTPSSLSLTNPVRVGNTLTATAGGSTDADSDSIPYLYEFYNEDDASTRQAYSTDNTYVIQVSDAHETIRVRTKVNDGYVDSGVRETTRDVSNTQPTTPSLTVTDPIRVGQTLTANGFGSTDTDSDSLTYLYEFYNSDDATTKQAYSTDNTYVIQSPSDAHDTIRVRVKTNDGLIDSNEQTVTRAVSDTQSTEPTDLAGFPANLYMGDTLTVTASGSTDADFDSITYQYRFYNVEDTITRQNWGNSNSYTPSAPSDSHDTIRVYTRSWTTYDNSPGAYYEEDYMDNTVPVITPPVILTSTDPATNSSLEDLLGSASATDVDLDSINTYRYIWYRNGAIYDTRLLLGGDQVSFTKTRVGDVWILGATPQDSFGDFGLEVNSTPLLITSDLSQTGELNESNITYNLTIDIINNDTGFNITADNITLNCRGHTIDGIDAAGTYGFFANHANNISLINCVFTDWDNAIYYNDSDVGIIYNNTASSSIIGIALQNNSDTNNVSNNTLTGNTAYGAYVSTNSDNNLLSLQSLFSTVADVYIAGAETRIGGDFGSDPAIIMKGVAKTLYISEDSDFDNDGIHVLSNGVVIEGQDHTLTGDLFGQDYAIYAANVTDLTIRELNMVEFGRFTLDWPACGIYLRNVTDSLVERINVSDSNTGIYHYMSDGNTIRDSIIKENNHGIEIRFSDHNTFTLLTVTGNDEGIWLRDGSSYNNITHNVATFGRARITLASGASFNYVFNNTVLDSETRGIFMDATTLNNTLIDNLVCFNTLSDIEDLNNNTGDNNTCDTGNWIDLGAEGCTNLCTEVSIIKAVNNTAPFPLYNVTWTINVTNIGLRPVNITIDDSLNQSFSTLNLPVGVVFSVNYTTNTTCDDVTNFANTTASNVFVNFTAFTFMGYEIEACGDGVCNCRESCDSCEQDCGTCYAPHMETVILTPPGDPDGTLPTDGDGDTDGDGKDDGDGGQDGYFFPTDGDTTGPGSKSQAPTDPISQFIKAISDFIEYMFADPVRMTLLLLLVALIIAVPLVVKTKRGRAWIERF